MDTELSADTPKNYSLNEDHKRRPEKLEPTVVTVVACTIAPHSFGGGRVEDEWGKGYGGGGVSGGGQHIVWAGKQTRTLALVPVRAACDQ